MLAPQISERWLSSTQPMTLTHSATGKPLLRRPASINTRPIEWSNFLDRPLFTPSFDCENTVAGKTVLVTGAGGSIGSALAHHLMGSLADTVVLLDHSPRNLHAFY